MMKKFPLFNKCQSFNKWHVHINSRSRHRYSVLTTKLSFQISPLRGTHPLAVFINPKSGGRQGARYGCEIIFIP